MNNTLPPPAMLMHLVAGKFVTQALAAAAELNVAEQLVDSPKTADEIAETMDRAADYGVSVRDNVNTESSPNVEHSKM